MPRRVLTLLVTFAMVSTIVLSAPREADATIEQFVDGTELELAITSPEDGASTAGGSVQVTGTARVGGGTNAADTVLVAVYDMSTSTWDDAGGDCGGNLNGDNYTNSIFDCQVAAVEALEQAAIEVGTVAEMGVTGFARFGRAADVRPQSGTQVLTAPGADLNGNGRTDISEVMRSSRPRSSSSRINLFRFYSVGSGTYFSAGFNAGCQAMAASSQPNRVLVFLSDGAAIGGSQVSTLSCGADTTIYSFAVGAGSTCDLDPNGYGSLNDIAALGAQGECFEIVAPDQLPNVLGELLLPRLERLTMTVNGGASVDISSSSLTPLPADGPVTVDWSTTVSDLAGSDNEICITAHGTNNGESLTSTECVTVGGNEPPIANAGEDQVVSEGALVTLDGSASTDPDGDPLSYTWSVASVDGQPPVFSSTTEPVVSFLAFDDATYTFDLTVSDGRATSTDSVVVTVENAAPEVSAAAEPAVSGGVSVLTASFTDPGLLDTHTATIDWGDGSLVETVPVSGQGNGWGTLFGSHVYADAGSYTATVTVTDDDGAVATAQSVSIEAVAPLALWADGPDGIDWTGGGGTVTGLTHSNGGIRTRGQAKTFDGPVEYVTGWDVKKTDTTQPPLQVAEAAAPVEFDIADYAPFGRAAIDAGANYFDMSSQCGRRWDPSGPLLPGLYYVPCDVKLNAGALDGEVTIVATGDIQVSGSGADFAPFIDGLLFLSGSTGNKAIQISTSGSTFLGFMNAPAGRFDVSGSGNTYLCGIVADRIDISDGGLSIEAVDCVRPNNTVAPPALVPNLATTVAVQPDIVIPGDTATTSVTATNDGAVLFVPGVVGIENLGDEPVTINSVTVGLEYLPIGGSWTPIAEPVTVDSVANPHPGVTYPADGFANTWVGAGGLASWGVQLEATLDSATVTYLLDENQVAGVRNTFDVDLFNATGEPVRRLFRYGNDFSAALRALSGDVTDATVFVSNPDGTSDVIDAIAEPALALIAPGQSVTIDSPVTIPVPAPRGADEPVQGYLDRLIALDNTLLSGSAYAVATGGVGTVLGSFTFDQTTRHVPVVSAALDGAPALAAGDVSTFEVALQNLGGANAATVTSTAEVDGAGVAVENVPAELAPGVIATATFPVAIPADAPQGMIDVASVTGWTDANGNVYGDINAERIVEVASAPELLALMADRVVDDADDTGLPSIGDTIGYSVTITNRGATPADDVVFTASPDPSSSLVGGSITTSQGTVSGAVAVDIGTIAPMASVEIAFEVVAGSGDRLSVQGLVTSSDVADVLTDDPGFPSAFDPTVTTLVPAESSLALTMSGRLGVDPDGNGGDGGDVLNYDLTIANSGLVASTDVEVTLALDPNTTVVVGSAEIVDGDGTVVVGNDDGDTTVEFLFPSIASSSEVEVTFAVTLNDDLPEDLEEVSAQALAVSVEQPDGVLSDDPALPGDEDPTVFSVTIVPGDPVDPPGDRGEGDTWGDDASFGEVSPTSNQVITAPVPVTAQVTPPEDTEVESWTIVAFPAGADPATGLVLGGDDGVPPAQWATFDPTVLSNGVWTIRLEATDDAGGTGVHEVSVRVEGQLKLGRFSVSWVDSAVPVGGIPVQVFRTYDSIERFGSDDFGYGWTLDVANFEVSTNRPLHEATWGIDDCGAGLLFAPICYVSDTPRIVNVTWPDGRVESFQLTPTGNTFVTGLAQIQYTALAGATSKLYPVDGDESAGINGFGQLAKSLFFPRDMYDPQRYVLEAIDGTRYVIDTDAGLVLATDTNNNTVEFTDAGIISSQGASLLFGRDEAGRITSVTEPDGSTVSYAYDGAGDLVSVVDQNGVTSSYTYDAGHFLVGVDDVSAAPYRTMTYSPDGRLDSITDRAGNTTSVSVDIDARTTVVSSPDGLLTTITTSDARGNVTRSEAVFDGGTSVTEIAYNDDDLPISFTDAAGGAWSFSYDGDRNLTSMTDANGATETFSYDGNGRVLSRTDRLGATTIYSYDTAGNLTTMTDGAGRTQTFGYDGNGNQISRTDGAGGSWARTVDAAGRTTSITDPNGNTTSMVLDANGRLVSRSWPDGGTESFSYDAEGNLVSHSDPIGRTTSYTYDAADRLVQRTDPAGGTTTWSYDANGRVLSETGPDGATTTYTWAFDRMSSRVAADGGVTSYAYDGAGRLVSMTDPVGRTSTYGYDPAGRRTSVTTPAGTSSMSYDGNGFLTSRSNANGETTTYGLNPIGQITAMTDPLGRATSYTYDNVGQRTAMTDPLGNNWAWSYDGAGRITTETAADGGTSSFSYDPAGNLTSSTDPAGRTTSYGYNPMNRQTSATLPGGGTATWTFDPAGQLSSATTAAGYVTSYGYDSLGRITQASDGLGNTTLNSYDPAGRLTSRTDPNGGTYSFTYDPVGRLTSETDPAGGTIAFAYNPAGQRTSFTNPNGATRTWTYDQAGRVASHADELGRITSYTHDPAGRQLSMTDPRGVTTNRVFDAAGQLLSETAGGESRAFAYDSGGRVTNFSDITGTTSMGWDPMGRITSVTSAAGTVGYSYNPAGERVTMTQPEGTTTYTYDNNGHLTSLTDWRNDTVTYANDADGRPTTATLPNGVTSTWGYDGAGRLTSIAHTGPNGTIDTYNYTLDNNGNRTSVTSAEGTETYTLDPLNRITAATYPDGTSETFTYDPAGNRTSHTRVDGTSITYTHNPAGQLISDSTGTTYTYDPAGNLTSTSTGNTYTYNPWGNLTSATVDGVTTTATYDATGTRVQLDGVDQLWDRTGYGTLISTSDGGNYLHAPGVGVLRDDIDWLLRDAIGSVRHITNTTADVTASTAFTAFGEPRATGTSVFGYAGEQTDPTGLIHLRARTYNPTHGTFTSYDPQQPGAPSTAGWNHYTYSANNPTTWTDPTGQITLTQQAILGSAAVLAAGALVATNPAFQAAVKQLAELLSEKAADPNDTAQSIAAGIWDTIKPDEAEVIELAWEIGTATGDVPPPVDASPELISQMQELAALGVTTITVADALVDRIGQSGAECGELFYHYTSAANATLIVAGLPHRLTVTPKFTSKQGNVFPSGAYATTLPPIPSLRFPTKASLGAYIKGDPNLDTSVAIAMCSSKNQAFSNFGLSSEFSDFRWAAGPVGGFVRIQIEFVTANFRP